MSKIIGAVEIGTSKAKALIGEVAENVFWSKGSFLFRRESVDIFLPVFGNFFSFLSLEE